MSVESNSLIEYKHIKIINRILAAGDRVEIIPVRGGIKVIQVKRREIKE